MTTFIDMARVRGLLEQRLSTQLAGSGVAYVRPRQTPTEPGALGSNNPDPTPGPYARIVAIDPVSEGSRAKPADNARHPIVVTVQVGAPALNASGALPGNLYGIEAALSVVCRALAFWFVDDTPTAHRIRLLEAIPTADTEPFDQTRSVTGMVQVTGRVERTATTGGNSTPPVDGPAIDGPAGP